MESALACNRGYSLGTGRVLNQPLAEASLNLTDYGRSCDYIGKPGRLARNLQRLPVKPWR